MADIERAAALLREAGVETLVEDTRSHQDAVERTKSAVAAGCDTVFACGGDGTIHAVLQALAHTPVQLAVIPFGTANALAHDLRIPFSPPQSVRSALHAEPVRIALGRIEYQDFNNVTAYRYFTVAAGIGVDAHLFYALSAGLKEKLGMAAYYLQAWQLWWTLRMQRFQAEFAVEGEIELRSMSLTQLLAVRIKNFGGVLRELAAGADLRRDDLRLVLCTSGNRLPYLSYVCRALIGGSWKIPEIELAYSSSVTCDANGARIYVEADGELLGRPPVSITMVPDALTILVPR